MGIGEALTALEQTLAAKYADHREMLAEVVRKVGQIVIDRQEYVVVYQREMKHLTRPTQSGFYVCGTPSTIRSGAYP